MEERIRIEIEKERKERRETRKDNYKMLVVIFWPIWVPLLVLLGWLIFK